MEKQGYVPRDVNQKRQVLLCYRKVLELFSSTFLLRVKSVE
ncbi:hypothetical protein P7266_0201 [Lactococcus cremoris]|nr:hypothetical protein P7266_0201 [Lactococcus cremoris]